MLNAHCHLELSVLQGAIPEALPFVEWLERLLPLKRALTPGSVQRAAARALQAQEAAGTKVLFDVVALDLTDVFLHSGAMRSLQFYETIAFHPQEGVNAVKGLQERAERHGPWPPRSDWGYSPHAPYTVTADLLTAAGCHAKKLGKPLCIHAAETPEETDMLTRGTGPLREFLGSVLPSYWKPPKLRPIEWLDECGCLGPNTLLVHGNDLNEADLQRLRTRGAAVVVCPGTHVYFDRGEFPLARLLQAEIPVFLGTDSLASNAALDMGREVRLARELCPQVPEEQLWRLVEPGRAARFLARGSGLPANEAGD